MIKVETITPTKNPKIVKVELVQVLTPLDIARGFSSKPKRHWETADAENHKFTVGQTLPVNIKMVQHDTPQYDDHKPFEKTGKYYTSELV